VDSDPNGNSISPHLFLTNKGSESVNLENFVIEYYIYEPDLNINALIWQYYYSNFGNIFSVSFSRLNEVAGSGNQLADIVISIEITSSSVLNPGESLTLQSAVYQNDWQYFFNETDDWSHLVDPQGLASYVVVKDDGIVVFGQLPEAVIVKGDANGDGIISQADVDAVEEYYVGLNPTPFYVDAADVNCDADVNIVDAMIIYQYIINQISDFPCN
jgi:hypothetical protein